MGITRVAIGVLGVVNLLAKSPLTLQVGEWIPIRVPTYTNLHGNYIHSQLSTNTRLVQAASAALSVSLRCSPKPSTASTFF